MWLSVSYKTSYHFMWILSTFSLFGSYTGFLDDYVVFRYFGHVDWVLNSFEKLLFYEMDSEIYVSNKWLRNMIIEILFKFRHELRN